MTIVNIYPTEPERPSISSAAVSALLVASCNLLMFGNVVQQLTFGLRYRRPFPRNVLLSAANIALLLPPAPALTQNQGMRPNGLTFVTTRGASKRIGNRVGSGTILNM